jgi:predicted transcriptional regulator of viral defense system
MKWDRFLEIARQFPLVESATIGAFGDDPRGLAVQLARWVRAGKLIELRRGLYVLSERLRYREPPLEKVANLLLSPSYVSLERALSIHGLIPETVPLVQSATVGRTGTRETALGRFEYRHVKGEMFFGYREMPLGDDSALVATPEKALLDLFYLSKGEFTRRRIEGLRLQDVDRLDLKQIQAVSTKARSPRVKRATEELCAWVTNEREAWRDQ